MSNVKITHLMPCSVTLLTVATDKERDAMTASSMCISEDPPLFVVSIHKGTLTQRLIEESGQFVLNIASTEQVKLAKKLGHEKAADKFKEFGIETEKATGVAAPIIKGSFASIECKVMTSFTANKFTVYMAEGVESARNEKLLPLGWYADRYWNPGTELK